MSDKRMEAVARWLERNAEQKGLGSMLWSHRLATALLALLEPVRESVMKLYWECCELKPAEIEKLAEQALSNLNKILGEEK